MRAYLRDFIGYCWRDFPFHTFFRFSPYSDYITAAKEDEKSAEYIFGMHVSKKIRGFKKDSFLLYELEFS